MLDVITMICSQPSAIAERCRAEDDLAPVNKASLVVMLVCTALFGLVLGGARDTVQALSTAVKLPLVWILTLSISAPAFYAMGAVMGQTIRLRALLSLILAATARASLVLFALLPVLWLFSDVFDGANTFYHKLTMLAALIYALSGLAALRVLLQGLGKGLRVVPLLGSFSVVFLLVAGQTAWSLRPFVGRPAETEVPLFRAPEGTFLDALMVGVDSAQGHYYREAPLPGSRNGGEEEY